MFCPVEGCRKSLVRNEFPEVHASLRCPVPHYLFYDESEGVYLVTKTDLAEWLTGRGARVSVIPTQLFARSILSKGTTGEDALKRYVKENMPGAKAIPLGKGASADFFVYDKRTGEFWFVEVKTSKDAPKFSPRLRAPEWAFAQAVIELGLSYIIAWLEEGKGGLKFFKIEREWCNGVNRFLSESSEASGVIRAAPCLQG